MDALIVGCGLTGAVIARHLAEQGKQVTVWDRRDHIGGNLYDYTEEHGFLVQKYGPHAFHTKKKALYDYICRFAQWQEYRLTCGAAWEGKCSPTPFNFRTVDTFFPAEQAEHIKKALLTAFPERSATVTEVLSHPDATVRRYGEYLFQMDYAPYTAKQWGLSPDRIDPSVLRRVPLRFSYEEGYFDDPWQVLPKTSYTDFFKNLLNHENIRVQLHTEALHRLSVKENVLLLDGQRVSFPVIYTGALDQLFGGCFGQLPYRSLRFEWQYAAADSLQPYPIVAYPLEPGYTRITEYKKLPVQNKPGTVYAREYPVAYRQGQGAEPYYPVLTEESQERYARYLALARQVEHLVCCGRLADFRYYNMDQALERALQVCGTL